jgi:WD40 repeat protein
VAFSSDGHLLATGGGEDGTVALWSAETGRLLRKLDGLGTGVWKVAFSPDGRRLAAVGWVEKLDKTREVKGELRVWDVATGQRLFMAVRPEGWLTCLAFSPDGRRLVTYGPGRSIRIWDAQTFKELGAFEGHHQTVYAVAFSPDGRLVASGGGQEANPSEQAVKIWDGETGQELFTLSGHLGTIKAVAFSPDGRRLASASADRTVKLWDVATGRETLTLRGHFDTVESVAFSEDGHWLASASFDQTVRLWAAAPVTDPDPRCLTLPQPDGAVTSAAFHPKCPQIAAAAYADGKVRLWDLALGKPRCCQQLAVGTEKRVDNLAFSHAGRWLAAVAGKELKVWNATTYEEVKCIQIPGDPNFYCVTFSPDEKQLAAAGYGNSRVHFHVRVWDVENDNPPRVLPGNIWVVCQVAFRPDGQHLASTGYDGKVRIWDVKTGQRIETPPLTPACPSHGLAFSPDGRRLALGSNDQVVRVWDTATWSLLHEYRDPGVVRSVAFSPDGELLAWGSTDATVKVWNMTGQRAGGVNPLVQTLHGHTNWVLSVAFSPDGRQIASASADGTVKIWKVPAAGEPPIGEASNEEP